MQLKKIAVMVATAALMTTSATSAQADTGHQHAKCLGLPPSKVAIQTYTFLSDLMKFTLPEEAYELPPMKKFESLGRLFTGEARQPTKEEVEVIFNKIHKIGYRNIEESSFTGTHATEIYAALLERTGLRAVASHESLDETKWARTLSRAKAAGQEFVGSGSWGHPAPETLEQLLQAARRLDDLGKSARDQGLKFYVHNHTAEFNSRFLYDHGDGKPVLTSAWEIVAANTDPLYVNFELDVYWAREAFGLENSRQLLDFLKKYRSRIVLLHMKDTAVNGTVADMGHGTTDWKAVVKAAGPGVRYYIYEFDLPKSPETAAKIGFEYLTCKNLSGK